MRSMLSRLGHVPRVIGTPCDWGAPNLRHGKDWKLFLSTFGAIFLAEMGDKTQLATLSLSANGASRWVVFAGSALALVATSAVAVLFGEAIARVIPPHWFKRER